MNLAYTVTGKERKKLVDIIAETINENAVYQKAPTYNYTIGESFTVTKDGELQIALNTDEEQITAVIDALSEAEFDYENSDILTISYPLEGFSDEAFNNLKKMISAKEILIKKALEVEDLTVEKDGEELQFPWFKGDISAEEIHAYSQFIVALCETAKSKNRVTATAPEAFENEKFAMRVFGIGLGLVGKEYTLCRKLLLKNLSGNSSWRYSDNEPKPHRERVHRDVVSVRFTPDMLAKLGELASQNGMSRNRLIENVIEEYVQSKYAEE